MVKNGQKKWGFTPIAKRISRTSDFIHRKLIKNHPFLVKSALFDVKWWF